MTIVRRVEAYIDAHARESLTLADLVAVAGVLARALQAGFRAAHGMSTRRTSSSAAARALAKIS